MVRAVTKAVKKGKPAKAAKARKARKAVTSSGTAKSDAIHRMLSGLPSLAPEVIAEFDQLFDVPECAELGARTRSLAVSANGTKWATVLFPVVKAGVTFGYGARRFVYFLTLLEALEVARAAQQEGNAEVRKKRGGSSRDQTTALAVLDAVEAKLRGIAGGRKVNLGAIDRATTQTQDQEGRIKALNALADLVDDVLKDHSAQILAEESELTRDDATRARRVAEALRTSTSVALGGQVMAHDSPAVNVIEGRVTLEMRQIRSCLNDAREHNKSLPKLDVDPGMRDVLGTHAKKRVSKNPGGVATPGPGPTVGEPAKT